MRPHVFSVCGGARPASLMRPPWAHSVTLPFAFCVVQAMRSAQSHWSGEQRALPQSRDVGGGELGVVYGAGGASAGWVEGGGILGGRPWEAESFPAIRGGAQQEAAGVQADGRSSGVSCSLSYPGCGLGMGIKFSGAPAFDHRGLPLQAGRGANSGAVGMGGGALMGKGGSRRSMGREGGIGAGMEHLSAGGARASAGGTGLVGASDAAGGVAHGGGRGAGNGARGWSATGRVGGSKVEGGLAGQ
ncbi:hypothetical protein E4T56_gene20197 [Termitomyces sp. T112]|nr:hypothetical protein E4T56_gene20197 [Termitomyces sp. T112]